MRRLLHALLWLWLLSGLAVAENAGEASVKAGFVFNFFKFIDWPVRTTGRDRWVLCIEGNNSDNEALAALEGKNLNGMPLTVRQHVKIEALQVCDMLYLADSGNSADMLQAVRRLPVVTVASGSGFIQSGGMIGLVNEEGRMRFEINLVPAHNVGIQFSTQLLRLAKTVTGTPSGRGP